MPNKAKSWTVVIPSVSGNTYLEAITADAYYIDCGWLFFVNHTITDDGHGIENLIRAYSPTGCLALYPTPKESADAK